MIIGGVEESSVRSMFEGRREKCCVLSATLKLQLRRVYEENSILRAAANEYMVRVKTSERRVDMKN